MQPLVDSKIPKYMQQTKCSENKKSIEYTDDELSQQIMKKLNNNIQKKYYDKSPPKMLNSKNMKKIKNLRLATSQ